jgi:hypothetical protein
MHCECLRGVMRRLHVQRVEPNLCAQRRDRLVNQPLMVWTRADA